MKSLITLLALSFAFASLASASEPQKSLLTFTVKRQLLHSEYEMLGRQGGSKLQTYALRVEITNETSSTVAESRLSGEALVKRRTREKQTVVKEPLGSLKLPAMKPNATVTLDLGKITLNQYEWQNQKFQETLEEWKIAASLNKVRVGYAESAHFAALAKTATEPETPQKKSQPAIGPGPGPLSRHPAH